MIEIEEKAKVWMDTDNVLTIKILLKSTIEMEDAKNIIAASAEETGDKLHGNLVDISEMTYMSREARSMFAGQESKTVKAIAVISNSKLHKPLVNLYFNISKPKIPTKFFNDTVSAKKWLINELKK
jgi:hypothetical protein